MRQIGSISDPHAGFVRQCDAPRRQDALNALHWKVADNQSPRRAYFESFRRSLALVAKEVAASEHANAVVDENGELYTVRYEAVNSMCFMRSSSNPLQNWKQSLRSSGRWNPPANTAFRKTRAVDTKLSANKAERDVVKAATQTNLHDPEQCHPRLPSFRARQVLAISRACLSPQRFLVMMS